MLDPAQLRNVEERVRAVEGRTGVQIVVAAIERADVYHGLRWRAFALGAAVSGAAIALGGALRPWLVPEPAPFWSAAVVLATGVICALAATFSPTVARFLLEPLRGQAEVRQRAGLLFLERELFATRERNCVLLLASGFERQAAVQADRGFHARVAAGEWQAVEAAMVAHLRAGRSAEGLIAGLDALERLLAGKGFAPAPGNANELPDRPLTGSGAP
jgi:putative membrane protein